MRSETVLSRRGLIVGTAAALAAPAPPEPYCFAITLPRLTEADIVKIRGMRQRWTFTLHSAFEARIR